ncbi:TIGR03759 family integrating conjugative element protein [Pseudomonas sp. LRF_L74]|uniref:TIGR03759 family integrating conjugative element protein n=1 Tax=Pseudomonas sp. LRF_L74 TaxID=3369422 RepID=UPI003F5E66DA
MDRRLTGLLACGLLIAHASSASYAANLHIQRSVKQPLSADAPSHTKAWGLNEQEWSRYQDIQKGPRGIWSPNLDPLTALGVEARSDAERQRYAELQVRLEAQRAERELAYQKAYNNAWARLYPGLMPVEGLGTTSTPSVTRLALFVEDNCPSCMDRLKQLRNRGSQVDVYLVGSSNDDAQVRRWAAEAGVDAKQVQQRVITLNHDNGLWFSLGAKGGLPAVFRQEAGQWQRVE